MRKRSAVVSLFLPLYLVLVFHGQNSSVQSAKNDVKFRIISDDDRPGATPSMIRGPRQTYFARIIEENPKQEAAATQVGDTSGGSHDKGDGKIDEGASGSSSSSSEEDNSIVFSTISSTTPNPSISGTSESPHEKRLELITKVQQQGRFIKSKPEKGHNWYQYKNKMQGRNIGGADGSNSVNEGRHSGAPTPAVPGGRSRSGKHGRHSRGGGTGETKRPYNVKRAKPSDIVDPDNYNFFQFKPVSKLGWLWLSLGKKVGGRVDNLGPDTGLDEDDLDPSNQYDWEFRRYDRACLYVEYKKQKSDAVIPIIPEELKRIVDVQNELLSRKFLDWQFNDKEKHETIALQGEGDKHPLHLTYKFLLITMELFRDKICRKASSYAVASTASAPTGAVNRALATANTVDTKLLPKPFIEDLFRLFLTLREITLTKNLPDFATKLDDEEVYEAVLEKCRAEAEDINWFSHSCGDQILSNDQPNNFACTPLVDYDYNSKSYDPILDGMWHMFNAVHAYCFKHFQINTRLWHRYSLIIANSYTVGMRQRWRASMASQKYYMRLLGPDHEVHFETMNRCMFGTVLRSDVPAVLPRFDTLSPITFGKERIIHKDGAVNKP